jgi:hypothetical protein
MDWTPVAALWPDAVLERPHQRVLAIPRLLARMTHRDAVLRPLGTIWDVQDRLKDLPITLMVAGPIPGFTLDHGLPDPWALTEAYMRLGYLPPIWVVVRLTAPVPTTLPVRTALWILAGARETTRWIVDHLALPARRHIATLKHAVESRTEEV